MRDQIRESRFSKALSRLAAACRQELDDLTLEVYTEALCYQVESDEWDRFTRDAVSSGRFQWFPKVVELLDALREFRGLPALDAEAIRAYERVNVCGEPSNQGGTNWTFRTVAARCGKAAAEAFVAAGGHSAFATTWNETKTREAFVAAYTQAARECPDQRLLPEGPGPKLLPAPVALEVTAGEAADIVRGIAERMQMPKITRAPLRIDTADPGTAARIAALREQGRRLVEDEMADAALRAAESEAVKA